MSYECPYGACRNGTCSECAHDSAEHAQVIVTLWGKRGETDRLGSETADAYATALGILSGEATDYAALQKAAEVIGIDLVYLLQAGLRVVRAESSKTSVGDVAAPGGERCQRR